MFDKKDKRFDVVYKDGGFSGCKVMIDRETGVNYLLSWEGYAGGLTTLLDKNGNPVISQINE